MCISVRNFSTSSFASSLTTPSYTLKTVTNKNSVFRPSFKPRSPITSSLTMSATWMYATIWRRIRNSMAPTLQNFYGKSTLTSMQSLARFTKVYGIRQMFGQQPSTKHNSSHITYHVTVVSKTCYLYYYCSHVSCLLCKHKSLLRRTNKRTGKKMAYHT
jgi:hypothetical protein